MDLLMQTAMAPMFHRRSRKSSSKNAEHRSRWLRIVNTWRQSSN